MILFDATSSRGKLYQCFRRRYVDKRKGAARNKTFLKRNVREQRVECWPSSSGMCDSFSPS